MEDIIYPKTGTYVVAVSGGVDSMVLVDLLNKTDNYKLIIAHFNHGIREDSGLDQELVKAYCHEHDLIFETLSGNLGKNTSEAKARTARYKFLRSVKNKHQAKSIILAHHQDDLIETAILNIIRGTGRKGLTSLYPSGDLLRPLINIPKLVLLEYAKSNDLAWREDSTNADTKYLRNYIRHNIVPEFSDYSRQEFLNLIKQEKKLNDEIDKMLKKLYSRYCHNNEIELLWFSSLDHSLSMEVMAYFLRKNNLSFDSRSLDRLVRGSKSIRPNKMLNVKKGYNIVLKHKNLALEYLER